MRAPQALLLTGLLAVAPEARAAVDASAAPPDEQARVPAPGDPAAAAATEAPPARGGCDRWRHPGLADGPIRIGFSAGDLGTGHRACARSEVALWVRGAAIIDTKDFYGALGATGLLSGSYAFGPGRRAEVFGTLAFVDFQFAQNASLKGTALGFGPITLGAGYSLPLPRDVTLAPYGRVLLPTATLGAKTMGGELGMSLSWHPRSFFELHALAALDVTFGVDRSPAAPRSGALASLGVVFAPWTWLALGLDLAMHLGSRAPLDYLAPAVALRFRLYRGLGLELAATLPLLGADRHDFLAALRIAYRF